VSDVLVNRRHRPHHSIQIQRNPGKTAAQLRLANHQRDVLCPSDGERGDQDLPALGRHPLEQAQEALGLLVGRRMDFGSVRPFGHD